MSEIEKISSKSGENQITYEIKTNHYNRNIQVKTKQEDQIYTKKKSTSPLNIQIHRPYRSSISNNSIENVRVTVNSSINKKISDDEKIYYHRPLYNLINQTENLPNNQNNNLCLSSSSSCILPAKQFSPFQPLILHRKSKESIDRFHFIDSNNKESLPSSPLPSRSGVSRSHTFTTPTDINLNSNEILFDNKKTTCQSTLDLNSSNKSILSPSINNHKDNSSLSTSTSSLTNNTNQTNINEKTHAKRKAIAMQMYDTEKSYVEALKNLVTKYYLPLKDKHIISNDFINDIFYKIPEIHIHHTAFLISLSQKLTQWDNNQTVGDVLLQMFCRQSVIETYKSFVNNYKRAEIRLDLCRDISSFNKFVEHQTRDHRGKLTLKDLIIQPIQRIPRYELYIKDFFKCTNINHPDYQLLLKAQSEIHSLAEQIDQVQKEGLSTELTFTNNSLEIVQDMIENLTDLVNSDRYYICHDIVTLQLSSGLKKDRAIFLFNDIIIITSYERKYTSFHKKTTNSIIVNSPSGKQYIDYAKHKLIMKISLENVEIVTDELIKRRSSISIPPSLVKCDSIRSQTLDKHRNLEEDILIINQINDLAKTITIPHQQLDESIKEILNRINKNLPDETISIISSELNYLPDDIQKKTNSIQLLINTTQSKETIQVFFPSFKHKITWEKNFLQAKKILSETIAGQGNVSFQHVIILPQSRPGSQLTCGIIRPCVNDLCVCNTEGEICLINTQSNVTLKSSNRITSSQINCIEYIPSNKNEKKLNDNEEELINNSKKNRRRTIDRLVDIDSNDDDDLSSIDSLINSLENNLNHEDDYIQPSTIWIGTDNGNLFIYECSQTINNIERKYQFVKQLNSSIHSILYNDNQVYLALDYGQICVFKRDINCDWDFDYPIIQTIDENSSKFDNKTEEINPKENSDPISIMSFAGGKLWCSIRDKIYIVCPNSLNVEHSFFVDDCHRHICSIATGGSSIDHVWIASQDSHDIRLYHAKNFICLLETSIKTIVTQKLQICDDIIRAHKLGCLYISTLHVYKETLWIGTSAGIILNLRIKQLIDSLTLNKLTTNSIQLKSLSYGHAGPVRFIFSTNKDKTFVITIGDGFDDYNNNDETLGKNDSMHHLILWKLSNI